MQGRLSPPLGDRIQAFPEGSWREEFALCRELGLGCIEWIFEHRDAEKNPLLSKDGRREIAALSERYGIRVNSVIADYFMVERLFGIGRKEVSLALETLGALIESCEDLGIPLLEIPLVDSSSLKSDADKEQFIGNLKRPLERAENRGVLIGLEADLPPKDFRKLLDAFKPLRVAANFDMGNSAFLGFKPAEEIPVLGASIANVHIKDRVKGGSTVPLGKGGTDFEAVFRALREVGYAGDFILQAARQDLPAGAKGKGPEETIREYIDFISPHLGALV